MSSTNSHSLFSSFGRRKKTLSECSDSSSVDGDCKSGSAMASNEEGNYLYDIDGKFAYSYYEKKPELYDIDGKHRYKYYSHLKRLPATPSKPSIPATGAESNAVCKPSYKAVVTGNYLYDIDGKHSYEVFDASKAKNVVQQRGGKM